MNAPHTKRKIIPFFSREEWDAICKRCGLCCYEKILSHGTYIIDLKSPCKYLDTTTHLCKVYEKRFQVCKECKKVTLFHALFSQYLPDSCGYVEKFRFWRKLFHL